MGQTLTKELAKEGPAARRLRSEIRQKAGDEHCRPVWRTSVVEPGPSDLSAIEEEPIDPNPGNVTVPFDSDDE